MSAIDLSTVCSTQTNTRKQCSIHKKKYIQRRIGNLISQRQFNTIFMCYVYSANCIYGLDQTNTSPTNHFLTCFSDFASLLFHCIANLGRFATYTYLVSLYLLFLDTYSFSSSNYQDLRFSDCLQIFVFHILKRKINTIKN